ncbi:MAG: DUF1858 domain-containing protein [Bacteroidota bacterium]
MTQKLVITPKTKILELIETYPQLEDMLLEAAPAFKKLKNPVLRKTVARVATVQQAAAIGDLKVQDLVNRLREAVGQDAISESETGDVHINYERPDWFDAARVTQRFDARPMLEAGEMPVHQVMADLKNLPEGEIYELTVPLLTVPLIEKAASLGFRHWVEKKEDELFVIRFRQ